VPTPAPRRGACASTTSSPTAGGPSRRVGRSTARCTALASATTARSWSGTAPDGEEWLASRLTEFRDGPCACLFGTDDLAAARDAYPLTEPHSWPDGRVAFFDSEQFGARLGVVERA